MLYKTEIYEATFLSSLSWLLRTDAVGKNKNKSLIAFKSLKLIYIYKNIDRKSTSSSLRLTDRYKGHISFSGTYRHSGHTSSTEAGRGHTSSTRTDRGHTSPSGTDRRHISSTGTDRSHTSSTGNDRGHTSFNSIDWQAQKPRLLWEAWKLREMKLHWMTFTKRDYWVRRINLNLSIFTPSH